MKVTCIGVGLLALACGGSVTGSSGGALGKEDAGGLGETGGVGGSPRSTGGYVANDGGRTNVTGGIGSGGTPAVTVDPWNLGGAAGGSAGDSCVKTDDEAVVQISGYDVVIDGGARTNEASFQGRVTDSYAADVAIDSCPALADCMPLVTKISVMAPNLDLSRAIPKGSLVSVHYKSDCPFGCVGGFARPREGIADLAVTSLGSWGGYTNPTPAPSGVYLAVADGGGSLPEFPFQVAQVLLLDCSEYLVRGCGGPDPGLYAFRFDEPSGNSVQLRMGLLSSNVLGNGTLSVQVLRSYQSNLCDDYMNWSYWVANAGD